MKKKKKLRNTCEHCSKKFFVKNKNEKKWKKLCLECWRENRENVDQLDIQMDRLSLYGV